MKSFHHELCHRESDSVISHRIISKKEKVPLELGCRGWDECQFNQPGKNNASVLRIRAKRKAKTTIVLVSRQIILNAVKVTEKSDQMTEQ